MSIIQKAGLVSIQLTPGPDSEKYQIKILVVDDDTKFLMTISERLGLRDFKVTTAAEGSQAIQAANTGKFDVALVDLKMPGIDGAELLKLLKEKHKFLEVIMLTGHASIDSAVACTKAGAFGYLEKPCPFETLIEMVKEAYKSRLKKKYEHDKKRIAEIEALSMGSSPIGILRTLARIDDGEK